MQYQHILLEVKDKIAWLTFNRPYQLNAMNAQMMNEIIDALGVIDKAPADQVAVAVITGAGKAFMAGADIKEYALPAPVITAAATCSASALSITPNASIISLDRKSVV